jgi:aspartate carbamoyltransferase catalytic subunit
MEPSTRTRVAFEIAAKSLSADVISIASKSSSLTKGESLKDTALNIQALGADAIVIRHSSPGSPLFLSKTIPVPIINAGDGSHEHPSQALLDIFTMQEKLGTLHNKNITILGDILFSRVARSNLWGLQKMGANVTLVGPSTLVPKGFEKMGAIVSHDIEKSLSKADAVMLLRIQHERQSSSHFPSLEEYTRIFGLSIERSALLKKEAIILHPGPINRGVEIDSTLADSKNSVILEQVTNGIAVRMAILYLCTTNSTRK